MGLKQTHKQEFKMRSTCTTRKEGSWCKLNGSGVADLIRTTSSTSFTWPATFERKHHSPPYSILCASMWGLHPNVTFPQDSQMGVPKLGLLLSQNFRHSYISQINFFLKMRRRHLITQNDLSNDVLHTLIQVHLTHAFKRFVVRSQISNLTPTFF
jgi:hypothetical protein